MRFGHRISVVVLLALAACATDPSDPLSLPPGGNFTYDAYSPVEQHLLTGVLHLEWADVTIDGRTERHLTGSWEIWRVPGSDTTIAVGPQVGSGQLVGTEGEDGVVLDLFPARMDDNVILRATVDGNRITGQWSWSTIAGVATQGRFTATPGR